MVGAAVTWCPPCWILVELTALEGRVSLKLLLSPHQVCKSFVKNRRFKLFLSRANTEESQPRPKLLNLHLYYLLHEVWSIINTEVLIKSYLFAYLLISWNLKLFLTFWNNSFSLYFISDWIAFSFFWKSSKSKTINFPKLQFIIYWNRGLEHRVCLPLHPRLYSLGVNKNFKLIRDKLVMFYRLFFNITGLWFP